MHDIAPFVAFARKALKHRRRRAILTRRGHVGDPARGCVRPPLREGNGAASRSPRMMGLIHASAQAGARFEIVMHTRNVKVPHAGCHRCCHSLAASDAPPGRARSADWGRASIATGTVAMNSVNDFCTSNTAQVGNSDMPVPKSLGGMRSTKKSTKGHCDGPAYDDVAVNT